METAPGGERIFDGRVVMPIFGQQFRRGFRMQRMNWTQGGLCPLELWKGDAMRKSLYDYCRETGETALLDEWARDENGFGPEEVSYGSKVKCWWRCAKGHLYQASVTSRTNEHTGCPYCCGRTPVPGENDLATLYPQLAAEWDAEKNGDLTPQDVLPGSHRYVWWTCPEGHSWRSAVKSRAAGAGCPVCAGRRLSPGENDLASSSPRLALEWDSEKNYPLTPHDVFPGSSRRVWWRCAHGHEWRARISSRTGGAGCPYCAGKRVNAGENDLATARYRDLLDTDTGDNLCVIGFPRLVVEHEQALAGEPPGDGAGPRPHAGILIILSDKGYLARDFPVFVAVLYVVCAAFAGYGVLRDSFRREECSVGRAEHDPHVVTVYVVECKAQFHEVTTPFPRVFVRCIV